MSSSSRSGPRTKTWLACLSYSAAALAAAGAAWADSAPLEFVEVHRGVHLNNVSDPVVTPDGKHVYVASYSSGLSRFTRDAATGVLEYAGVTSTVNPFTVDVSPDGRHVYAGSPTALAVSAFVRDVDTGALSLVNQISAGGPLTVNGYISLNVSPDGAHVYVVGGAPSGLAVFHRDRDTGAIDFVAQYLDGVAGHLLGQGFSPTASPINNIAFNRSGGRLYITSTEDDAISVYDRDTGTGELTRRQAVVDGLEGVDGIDGASSLVLSGDGAHLYVSGQSENAVAVFAVDADTGELSYIEKYVNGIDATNLAGARSLAISPDGRYVYVSAIHDHAVSVFTREPGTGRLSFAMSAVDGTHGVDGLGQVSGMVTDPLNQNLYAAAVADGALTVFSLPVPGVVLSRTRIEIDPDDVVVVVDPQLEVFDADDTHLRAATVRIAEGHVPGDVLSAGDGPTDVLASFDSATGVLSLTGDAELRAYRDVLRGVTFTPAAGSGGERVITFSVFDGQNTSAAPSVTVHLVQPPNLPPLALADAVTVPEDQVLTHDLLANDSDPDGEIDRSSVEIVTGPSRGTANVSNGVLTYRPNVDYNGTDTLTYRVRDQLGLFSDPAVVTITVTPVNDPPRIEGIPPTQVLAGQAYYFAPSIEDHDSANLMVTGQNLPVWATLDRATGRLTGSPDNSHAGLYRNILLTVSDGDATAELSGFSIRVLHNSALEDDTGSDDDGDTGDPDAKAPVIATPRAARIDATGLLTAFPKLTAPKASDGTGAPLKAALERAPTHLVPGTHTVTWAATDAAGRRVTARQRIDVNPIVSLASDQVRAEGSVAAVRFLLNGYAPVYPLEVAYTVSGTADLDDHDARSGVIAFAAGATEVVLPVTLHDDGVYEGEENVRITLTGQGNFGAKREHVITIVEGNRAPALVLRVTQAGRRTTLLTQDGGSVTLEAQIDDPNPGDRHQVEWQLPAGLDGAIDGTTATLPDAAALAPGLYVISLTVRDDGNPALVASASQTIRVVAEAPTLTADADSDGDGISDAAEGFGDGDGDGLPDYLDASELPNVLAEYAEDGGRYLIESEAGTELVLGDYARLGSTGAAVSATDPASQHGGLRPMPSDRITNVGGYMDFTIRRLGADGLARVVVPQRQPVPEHPVYRKLTDGMWFTFVEDLNNHLASAAGASGICPPPGDAAYQPGLTPGHWCVQLSLEDGGPNDADGQVNGAIVDPGGVGENPPSEPRVRRGGGGALGLPGLFGLLCIALWWRRVQ